MIAMREVKKSKARGIRPETQVLASLGREIPLKEDLSPQEKLNRGLITAANSGMLSKVEELRKQGADPHWKNSLGMRAIDYAEVQQFYRVVDFLKKEMEK